MTVALLALLNLQVAGIVVYAVSERRSASHYRTEHLQFRDDELVYRDLLARVVMGRGRSGGAVVAGKRAEGQHGYESDAAEDVAHDSSSLLVGS